jgi:Tol biopolymer transport system component
MVPNGAKIVFASDRDHAVYDSVYARAHINKEIQVMNADGSGQLRLTNDLANNDAPS